MLFRFLGSQVFSSPPFKRNRACRWGHHRCASKRERAKVSRWRVLGVGVGSAREGAGYQRQQAYLGEPAAP